MSSSGYSQSDCLPPPSLPPPASLQLPVGHSINPINGGVLLSDRSPQPQQGVQHSSIIINQQTSSSSLPSIASLSSSVQHSLTNATPPPTGHSGLIASTPSPSGVLLNGQQVTYQQVTYVSEVSQVSSLARPASTHLQTTPTPPLPLPPASAPPTLLLSSTPGSLPPASSFRNVNNVQYSPVQQQQSHLNNGFTLQPMSTSSSNSSLSGMISGQSAAQSSIHINMNGTQGMISHPRGK